VEQIQLERIGNYYTIDGAARQLGVTVWTLYGYIKRHNIPTAKLGGKATLVKLTDLEGLRSTRSSFSQEAKEAEHANNS
jgi:excisionase family DNA binding protein